jgi:hypothetical protein
MRKQALRNVFAPTAPFQSRNNNNRNNANRRGWRWPRANPGMQLRLPPRDPDAMDTSAVARKASTCKTEVDRKRQALQDCRPRHPSRSQHSKTAASRMPQVPDFETTCKPTARNTSKSNAHTPNNLQRKFLQSARCTQSSHIMSTCCLATEAAGRR